MSMKNSNDTIGNRTRDLPTCSVVPQSTALPRVAEVVKCVYAETEEYVFTTRKQLGGHDNFQKESYSRPKKCTECLDILATYKGARRRKTSITRWK
jgi:hypothetical protein